jgi:hypothetical protein
MDRANELKMAGLLQARLCRENGSHLYGAIIDALVAGLAGGSAAVELLREDPRDAVGSALYLRLLGAVNRLVRADPSCPLRAWYPSAGGHRTDVDKAVPAFFAVVAEHADTIAAEMQTAVQTNEVGRSAPLSAAFNYVGEASGAPLRLLEIGASAGLNLWPDRYRVCATGAAWGPVDSPVKLCGHFVSGDPPATGCTVVERRGCDINPLDIGTKRAGELLRSFIWPEHIRRLRRLDAALAAGSPAPLDRRDACSWTREQLTELPAGVTTVVFHSIVLPYLTDDEREGFTNAIRAAGDRADNVHRLAWVSLEPAPDYHAIRLACERWPERERAELALSNPHGEEVRWAPVVRSVA